MQSIQVGHQALAAGRLEDAVGEFKKAIDQGVNDPEIFFHRGLTLAKLGRLEEAVSSLEQTLERASGHVLALLNLGLAKNKLGRYQEAIVHFQKSIDLAPERPEGHLYLGEAYFKQYNFELAARHIRRAVEISPNLLIANYNLGLSLNYLGHKEEAKACYQKTISLDPTWPHGYFGLAHILFFQGDNEGAINHYRKAIKLDPELPDAYYNLGIACYKTGRRREGALHLNKNLQSGANQPSGPSRLRIEVSSACNLRCRHCPTGVAYDAVPRTIMSMGLFEKLLQQLPGIPNLRQFFMYLGGEPLLNRNLASMCRQLRATTNVEYIFFNTNAMLVTEAVCEELAGVGISKIEISVDGRSPEENETIRQGAHYDTVKKNIALLRNSLKNTEIVLANTILKRPADPELAITPEFLKQDFPGMVIETNYAMKWPGIACEKSIFHNTNSEHRQPACYCDKPYTEMVVRANGDIVLCCYDLLNNTVIGNIRDTNLMELWMNPAYRALRDNVTSNNVDRLPSMCRQCIIYSGETPIAKD